MIINIISMLPSMSIAKFLLTHYQISSVIHLRQIYSILVMILK